jgi:Lon protease-like protein
VKGVSSDVFSFYSGEAGFWVKIGGETRRKTLSEIPLFPLNVVLMPGTPLPLHIFEERYKQMVNECLEGGAEFGMVLADESGTRQVGCTAKIVELVQRFDDGRMVILVEGSRRFKLKNIMSGKPYYMGDVEYLEEGPEEDVTLLAEECVALLELVVEAATEGSVDIEIEPPYHNLSFNIAGRIEFDLDTRQQILELPTEKGRLEKVKELLAETAAKLERERQVREKAEKNGYLRGNWKPTNQEDS